MEGELYLEERKFLYQAIIQKKPKIVLEIGTGGGDGSTYQIATALKRNFLKSKVKGCLHTCEVNPSVVEQAKMKYSTNTWHQTIICWQEFSHNLIDMLITDNNPPNFIFFDGPEDPQIALNDIKRLEPHLKPKTWFCMHDWDLDIRPDGNISTKSTKIRPYIESSTDWKILRSLTAPESVGIVLAEFNPSHQ